MGLRIFSPVAKCLSILVLAGFASTVAADVDLSPSRIGLNSSGSGDDFHYYGEVGGIRAFSIAVTACNVGDLEAEWVSGALGNHPLIATNMYRLLDGRFEQIGMAWVHHTGICAVSEPTCGGCQSTPCSTLGIGCASTSWGILNGDQTLLGPRTQINPEGLGSGGTHTDPHPVPVGNNIIRGRLQIHDVDISAGGQNFAEKQFVTHDEPGFNRQNNASWREVNLGLTSISGVGVGQASVHMGEPALFAWQLVDPTVSITQALVPNGGQFYVGSRATDLGNGTWQYEYALYNMNAERGASAFSVSVPLGVTVSSLGFHDVDYHSGDGVNDVTRSGIDWTPVFDGGGSVSWSTEFFQANENANALMWGTLYNFRFVANAPPAPDLMPNGVTIQLFKPGTGNFIATRAMVPSANAVIGPCDSAVFTRGDINNDTFINGGDIDRFTEILVAGGGTTEENCAGDLEAVRDDMIDMDDVPNFVSCVLAGGCP